MLEFTTFGTATSILGTGYINLPRNKFVKIKFKKSLDYGNLYLVNVWAKFRVRRVHMACTLSSVL